MKPSFGRLILALACSAIGALLISNAVDSVVATIFLCFAWGWVVGEAFFPQGMLFK